MSIFNLLPAYKPHKKMIGKMISVVLSAKETKLSAPTPIDMRLERTDIVTAEDS
jgi:hypothetical protein